MSTDTSYLSFDSAYDRDRDVRVGRPFTDLLSQLGHPPDGKVHWVVGARRSGKTWAARRLAAELGSTAAYVDLRALPPGTGAAEEREAIGPDRVAIIDEPGEAVRSNAGAFVDGLCRRHRHSVVFATPWELAAVAESGRLGGTIRPMPLTDLDLEDVEKMTARCEHHEGFDRIVATVEAVGKVDPRWLATPLRLECVCAAALDWIDAAGSGPGSAAADEMIARARARYHERGATLHWLVGQGLSPKQRRLIRSWWWPRAAGAAPVANHVTTPPAVLARSNHGATSDFAKRTLAQVWTASEGFRDPVLDEWLTVDVRLHHVSDLHLGGAEAATANVKAANPTATAVAEAMGVSGLAEAYAQHLHQLAEGAGGDRPHRVIVTGDLVHNASEAADQPELVERARAWLEHVEAAIAPHAGSTTQQAGDRGVVLLPGNHDIDRRGATAQDCRPAADGNADRRHGWFMEQFGQWCPEPGDELRLTAQVGIRVLWSTAPAQTPVVSQAECSDPEHWSDPSAVAGDAIVALARGSLAEVCIVALHHAVAPMPDTEVGEWSQLVNAGAVQEACLNGRVALVMHGHAHRGWLGAFSRPRSVEGHRDERWTTRVACAATLSSGWAANEHGFNEVIVASERRAWSRESDPLRTVGVRSWSWNGSHWAAGDWCLFHPGAADELEWDELLEDG